MADFKIQFDNKGTFEALRAAKEWCGSHNISVGQSSATGPTALLFGDYSWIAKWRNLSPKERTDVHGEMFGEFREGPVIISLKHGFVLKHAPYLLEGNSSQLPRPKAEA